MIIKNRKKTINPNEKDQISFEMIIQLLFL